MNEIPSSQGILRSAISPTGQSVSSGIREETRTHRTYSKRPRAWPRKCHRSREGVRLGGAVVRGSWDLTWDLDAKKLAFWRRGGHSLPLPHPPPTGRVRVSRGPLPLLLSCQAEVKSRAGTCRVATRKPAPRPSL